MVERGERDPSSGSFIKSIYAIHVICHIYNQMSVCVCVCFLYSRSPRKLANSYIPVLHTCMAVPTPISLILRTSDF